MHVIIKNIGDESLRIIGAVRHDDQLGHEVEIDRLLGPGQGADLDGLPENMDITVRKFCEVEAVAGDGGPNTDQTPPAGTETDHDQAPNTTSGPGDENTPAPEGTENAA